MVAVWQMWSSIGMFAFFQALLNPKDNQSLIIYFRNHLLKMGSSFRCLMHLTCWSESPNLYTPTKMLRIATLGGCSSDTGRDCRALCWSLYRVHSEAWAHRDPAKGCGFGTKGPEQTNE